MKDNKLESLLAICGLLVLMWAIYLTFDAYQDCSSKGGVYLAQQATCIKAEVL